MEFTYGADLSNQRYYDLVDERDIVYKEVNGRKLSLDILYPTKRVFKQTPVLIFFHGGSWVSGEKADLMSKTRLHTIPRILEAGYAVVSASYRLLEGGTVFPMNIIDAKDAVRYIVAHADDYGFDRENIGLMGSSAGAHLALMAAYTKSTDFQGEEVLADITYSIRYVIDINGPVDIIAMGKQQDPEIIGTVTEKFFGKRMGQEEIEGTMRTKLESFFPLAYINRETVPTLILHGTRDTVVSIEQSEILYFALQNHNCDVKYITIKEADHGLVPIEIEQVELVSNMSLEFMKANYRG